MRRAGMDGVPKPSQVTVAENPITTELLGPDGKPISKFSARRIVPFGFQLPATDLDGDA